MKKAEKRQFLISALLLGIIAFGAYSFKAPQPQQEEHHENNLKILPKNISHDDLMFIMKSYTKALGYKCSDCHAPSASDPKKLDFASYNNHHKTRALEMMKMVAKINKKNFGIKGKFADNFLSSKYKVTCYTCHHGQSHPEITPQLPEAPRADMK